LFLAGLFCVTSFWGSANPPPKPDLITYQGYKNPNTVSLTME
jgi:hypothetical protein